MCQHRSYVYTENRKHLKLPNSCILLNQYQWKSYDQGSLQVVYNDEEYSKLCTAQYIQTIRQDYYLQLCAIIYRQRQ